MGVARANVVKKYLGLGSGEQSFIFRKGSRGRPSESRGKNQEWKATRFFDPATSLRDKLRKK
ncbi:unnamed protein product, partial [Nesidiocoris tenuis]